MRGLAATCFGLGHCPVVPGSVGSAAAAGLWLAVGFGLSGWRLSVFAAAACVVLAAVGIAIGRWAQEVYKQRDPNQFVLDHAAGMLLALVAVTPTVWGQPLWPRALAAFVLFRVLDVVKPFPAGRAEALPAGWGIVLDDLAAGAYAALCVHLWWHFAA